jgi:hypothetical protein
MKNSISHDDPNERGGENQNLPKEIEGDLTLHGTFKVPIQITTHPTLGKTQPNKRPKSSIAEIVGIGFATFVGLLLVGVGILQYCIYSKQTVLSTQYNHFTALSQRPFISIGPDKSYVSYDGNYAVNFLLDFKNDGNTAATHAYKRYRCDKSKTDLVEPWSFMKAAAPGSIQTFIGPHNATQGGCSFTLDEMRKMQAGELFGYILADVIYADPLSPNAVRKTQFAVKVEQVAIGETGGVPSVNELMQSIGAHNCADDDCPND